MFKYSPERGLAKLRDTAAVQGVELISDEWLGAGDQKYIFRCSNRFHPDYEKSFAKAVNSKQGCYFCIRNAPASTAEAKAVLFEQDFDLEEDVHEAAQKVWAVCVKCGARHHSTYSELRRRQCAHIPRSDEPAEARIRRAVEAFGGEILGGNFSRMDDKWQFRCKKGHKFSRIARTVLPSNGHPARFCTRCSPKARASGITIQEIREIAEAKGGKILAAPDKLNASVAVLLVCSLGHEFEKDWAHLRRGQWCAICSKGSKSEEIARVVFQTLFGEPFKKSRPKWLRYPVTGRLLELDGFNSDLGIAFEYQGAQHRDWQIGNEGKRGLNARLARDEWKRGAVREAGITLIELWDTTPYEDFAEEIGRQLRQAGRSFPSIDFSRKVGFDSAFIRDDRLLELRNAVKSRQITLLSEKWIGVHESYEFSCDVCGHSWRREAASYIYDRSPGCEKCGYFKGAAKRKRGMKALEAIAAKHGGEILSTEYTEIRDSYLWRCEYGHEFNQVAHNMAQRGTFCTQCGKTSLQDLSDHAAKFGGKLLSAEFKRRGDQYRWLCTKHGEFQRTFTSMTYKKDSFCVECGKQQSGLEKLKKIASAHGGVSLSTEWAGKKDGIYSFRCEHGKEISLPGYAVFYRDKWCSCS